MSLRTVELTRLETLDERSRSCLARYVELLRRELGESLLEVRVFGSVARGEEWPQGMPIRSDIDLLAVVAERVPPDVVERLVNETYPLFLECGRQLGPHFRTPLELEHPPDERTATFYENLRRDSLLLWSAS